MVSNYQQKLSIPADQNDYCVNVSSNIGATGVCGFILGGIATLVVEFLRWQSKISSFRSKISTLRSKETRQKLSDIIVEQYAKQDLSGFDFESEKIGYINIGTSRFYNKRHPAARFKNIEFFNSSFVRTKFGRWRHHSSDLIDTSFINSTLVGVSFENCSLQSSIPGFEAFRKSKCIAMDLSFTKLINIEMTDCDIRGLRVWGASITESFLPVRLYEELDSMGAVFPVEGKVGEVGILSRGDLIRSLLDSVRMRQFGRFFYASRKFLGFELRFLFYKYMPIMRVA
jgi:hypothetical protein